MGMAKVGLSNGVWVLVCDGAKALLFENTGDAQYPKLETREVMEHSDVKDREIKSDAPGRTFSSSGTGRRGGGEEVDYHDQAEEQFLKAVAHKLDTDVGQHRIRHLIVVAPNRALGRLRHQLSHGVQSAIVAELDKDYVKMPVYEIEKHLAKALKD
jgi:protein required for attachment to host cells